MNSKVFRWLLIPLVLLAIPACLYSQSVPDGAMVHSAVNGGINFVNIIRGILGISVVIFLGFLLSNNRRAINWHIILIGLIIQVVIALAVLKVPVVMYFF